MSESADVFSPAGQHRRCYATPTLVMYGNLVELTATGSIQAANESSSGPNPMCDTALAKMSGACGNP